MYENPGGGGMAPLLLTPMASYTNELLL